MAGRPKEFWPEVVLERAAEEFTARGFAATSIEDLVGITGVARQSLYNAFGDKRSLYVQALAAWIEADVTALAPLRVRGSGLLAIATFLQERVRYLTGDPRNGLFDIVAAADLGAADAEVAQLVQLSMRRTNAALARCLRRAIANGEIGTRHNPTALARLLTHLLQGIALAANAGVSRRSLLEVVDAALRALSD